MTELELLIEYINKKTFSHDQEKIDCAKSSQDLDQNRHTATNIPQANHSLRVCFTTDDGRITAADVPHRYRRITLPIQEEIIYHLWQDGIPFTPQYPDALKQGRSAFPSAFSSDLWREGKGRTRGISGLRKSSI